MGRKRGETPHGIAMLENGKIPKKKSPLSPARSQKSKNFAPERPMRSKESLALTHWVCTPKIGEHHPGQDIHSVLHNGGAKIKISGNADPTPSL
jgi:hypothetical protein